ncbi:DUF308 domain-containing protein [Defluviimonas sp. WL0024]|uniref:DUF308 domain-containing protein n=1 Tax=Albidovulum salinarum TaxID=2984153 RepID=A0ABT2XB19_9RHOB|nr:DUF308 domain-containing protein [Defluviimonas sp. WL0024]MCU9850237.1 DUF308 domain-containing protein [Defluviimonas sp. WL0024]
MSDLETATYTRTIGVGLHRPDLDAAHLAPPWRVFIVRGLAALLLAALVFLKPGLSFIALTLAFAAFALVEGGVNLAAGMDHAARGRRWGAFLAEGVLGVAAGAAVLTVPILGAMTLTGFVWSVIAVWSLGTGVAEILAAIRLRLALDREWFLALSGAGSIVFGALLVYLMLAEPGLMVSALVWLIGIYASIFGLLMIALGIRMKREVG